jgi:isopentenyldiphosphate isomerase
MTYPPVVIVDRHDIAIGEAPLREAWDKRLIHRVVLVILENDRGEVLLQRRAAHMQLYPGCWDISAGGHVDEGHDYREAAELEVEEELGIRALPLLLETAYFYTDQSYPNISLVRRFVKIYRANIDSLSLNLEPDEVSDVRWFSPEELDDLMASHPEEIASGLLLAYEHVLARNSASIAY